MSDRILVPVLGESVTEATVAKWLKNEGDKVNVDEPIVELETDKVNVEVPAPSNGILENISVKEGQTVNVGALLGTMNVLNNSAVNLPVEEKEYAPPPKKPEEIKEIKNIEKEKVTNEASFIDDLGADSLDTVELVMAFEEEFGSEISDSEAEKILTVGDAIKFIESKSTS